MKITIILSVLIIIAGINLAVVLHHENVNRQIELKKQVQLELRSTETEKIRHPYTFHYVGKEKFGNVFAMYRLNKETGELIRFAYTHYAGEEGGPDYSGVSSINMQTGMQDDRTGSIDLIFLQSYFREKADKEKKKKEEDIQ